MEDCKDLWQKLKEEKPPVVLYGMNNIAEKVAAKLSENGVDISGIMVSEAFLKEKCFLGFPLETLAQIEARLKDFVILLCFGTDRPEVLAQIREISAKHPLYAPDLPVAGDGFFDEEYYQKHRPQFEALAERLADDQSRRVLKNTIRYKLSGDLSYLFAIETPEEECWKLALPCTDLLDLGAYTGDTAALFERLVPDYHTIFAAEPEERNFRKLADFAKDRLRIRTLRCGVGDRNESVLFPKGSGRGSGAKKYIPTDFFTVDELCRKENLPTDSLLVKMDLEGWEEKAIRGAAQLIRNHHPNLLIAAYHRLDDLWRIPAQVLSLYPDYLVYLRHSPCIPAWENNYVFVNKNTDEQIL